MTLPLDYEILRLLWWAILGVLLIGFAVLQGFDLGVAILSPAVTKNDMERRILLNTTGPVWESNQVWLILGGGAVFAAWPLLYSVSFSGLYLGMFLALFTFILRPVGFKFRSKKDSPTWRFYWDVLLFIGGIAPALVLGLALGNVVLGLPFHFTNDLRVVYTGTFWQLFTPFPILCGVLCILTCARQGAAYLCLKTIDSIQEQSKRYLSFSNWAIFVLFTVLSIWAFTGLNGYEIAGQLNPDGPSNPLFKQVIQSQGWTVFKKVPLLYAVPALVLVFCLTTQFFNYLNCYVLSFISSSISTAMLLATFGISLFPLLLPSSTNLSHSLTIFDASSSHLTLFVMLLAVIIFLPIVLVYISWAYRVMKGPVTQEEVNQREGAY